MAELFSKEWAAAAKDAINGFPDDAYRETKLFMYWDWIDVAKNSFAGSLAIGDKDADRYVTFTFKDGVVTDAVASDGVPDATFVLAGDQQTWKDIVDGYDAGKAVMYRRIRLVAGDVFRFFNRIYLFTESLVAVSRVETTLPAA